MAVSDAEVRRMAALARLPLTDAEARQLVVQIGAIIAHADTLAELEAAAAAARHAEPGDAAAAAAGAEFAALRADMPGAARLHQPPAAFAPAWADGFFTVPRMQ